MNTSKVRNSIIVGLFCAVLLAVGYASAATKGDPSPAFTHGSVDVLASAPTLIPGMGSANAVLVQNLGPNPIYCGNSAVTTSSGIQVPQVNGTLTIDIVQFAGSTTTIRPELYCIAATADQAGTADTRYMRVR